MNSIDQRVIELLQSFLQTDLANPSRDTCIPELDSIDFLELVVRIEIEFDIELFDEELLYSSNLTIQNWIDIVKSHISDKDNRNKYDPLLR